MPANAGDNDVRHSRSPRRGRSPGKARAWANQMPANEGDNGGKRAEASGPLPSTVDNNMQWGSASVCYGLGIGACLTVRMSHESALQRFYLHQGMGAIEVCASEGALHGALTERSHPTPALSCMLMWSVVLVRIHCLKDQCIAHLADSAVGVDERAESPCHMRVVCAQRSSTRLAHFRSGSCGRHTSSG